MDLKTILEEADIRVPNAFSPAQKVDWLNEVNYEFFDIVKMPKVVKIASEPATTDYMLPFDCRKKNIRKVVVGSTYYRSMDYEEITAGYNWYTFDDPTHYLLLSSVPQIGQDVIVVYDIANTTPFLATNMLDEPQAPPEYHWIYILGLCTRIAKAMNDVVLANNYDNDYKGNLAIAQQNFLRS